MGGLFLEGKEWGLPIHYISKRTQNIIFPNWEHFTTLCSYGEKKTNKVEPVTTGILLQPLGEMRDEGKMVGKNRRHQACRH